MTPRFTWLDLPSLYSKAEMTKKKFHYEKMEYIDIFFDKSEFISKSANLKGAPPNYTKSITKMEFIDM
jgi:hypothetical protein